MTERLSTAQDREYKVYLTVVLISISLETNNVGHLYLLGLIS